MYIVPLGTGKCYTWMKVKIQNKIIIDHFQTAFQIYYQPRTLFLLTLLNYNALPLHLVYKEERKSYRFGRTLGRGNDDNTLIFVTASH